MRRVVLLQSQSRLCNLELLWPGVNSGCRTPGGGDGVRFNLADLRASPSLGQSLEKASTTASSCGLIIRRLSGYFTA